MTSKHSSADGTDTEQCRKRNEKIKRGCSLTLQETWQNNHSQLQYLEKQKCDNRIQQISSERMVLLAPGSISGCFPPEFLHIFQLTDPLIIVGKDESTLLMMGCVEGQERFWQERSVPTSSRFQASIRVHIWFCTYICKYTVIFLVQIAYRLEFYL